MNGQLSETASQIVEWLRIHAPVTHRHLQPPADDDTLARLASDLGRELPPDLVELLRCFNGSGNSDDVTGAILLPPGFRLLPASEMAEPTLSRSTLWPNVWEPSWIAIGEDFCGYALVLDAQPVPTFGRVFEFDKVDGPFGVAWHSLTDLLTETLALLQGEPSHLAIRIPFGHPRPPYHMYPLIEDGELEWERD
jgi:cell wall assembly regulator SMI1